MKNLYFITYQAMGMFARLTLVLTALLIPFLHTMAQRIDIQGHRGARGLMPENTIPSFKKALDMGVTTIEIDVVISGDSLVVVSHEPYFSADICTDSLGNALKSKEAKNHNIFKMSYNEISKYDCGSAGNKNFPEQEKLKTSKPLLKDVIKEVEAHIKSYTFYEVDYNIEIKSSPSGDNIFHPTPEVFSDIVYELIDQYLPWERVIIQSFDFRVLKYWNTKYPEVRLAALVSQVSPISAKLNELGFEPEIYSPHFRLLNKAKVEYLHERGIKVIPWTVNEVNQMKEMIKIGVDGIITDYPNRAVALVKK